MLRLEILRAVLADHLDPGLDEHRHVGERDVLRRRDDRHARADLGADRARSARGSQPATAPITPWTPRTRAAAAVREEELRVAARAEVEAVDASRRPRAQRALGRRPEVEDPARGRGRRRSAPRPRRRPRSSTGPIAGPDDGRRRPAAERRDARLDDAVGEPAPARVHDRERRRVRRARAIAIGRQSADSASIGSAGLVRPEPVARLARCRAASRAVHGRRVPLPVDGEPRRVEPERVAGDAAGSRRRAPGRRRPPAEVERGERPLAHPADPRRERDHVRARRLPADHSRASSLLRRARAASRACSAPGRRRPPRAASRACARAPARAGSRARSGRCRRRRGRRAGAGSRAPARRPRGSAQPLEPRARSRGPSARPCRSRSASLWSSRSSASPSP